jgi:hypothetical protein
MTKQDIFVKLKSPTSLSIFPEKSPQMQGENPNVLNVFTTRNVEVRNKNGHFWNIIENNKLAYKRSARGAAIGTYPKIIYGPPVELLTSSNYKKLKKGNQVYYDRGSILFRGPFVYEKTLRGPTLLFTIRDAGYLDKIYKFTIPVNKLKSEQLFLVKRHADLKSTRLSPRGSLKSRKRSKKSTSKKSTSKKSTRKKSTSKKSTSKKSTSKKSTRKKSKVSKNAKRKRGKSKK